MHTSLAAGAKYLRTPEAADYLRVSADYLNKLRQQKKGPRFIRLGRRVVYDRLDLDAWASSRTEGEAA